MVEAATTPLFRLGKITNKYIYLKVLLFASTEEYQADRYLYQACRSTRHMLFKSEQAISLYRLIVFKVKSLPLPSLYYMTLMPLKERRVLKLMLTNHFNILGDLLYNAKIDGWTASKFHELCDGRGPTVTLLRVSSNNHWIGGFTSISWSQVNKMFYDKHAFLFNLTTADKFNIIYPTYAVNHGYCYGPCFGFRDLLTLRDGQETATASAIGESLTYYCGDTYEQRKNGTITVDFITNNLSQTECHQKDSQEPMLATFKMSDLQVWTVKMLNSTR